MRVLRVNSETVSPDDPRLKVRLEVVDENGNKIEKFCGNFWNKHNAFFAISCVPIGSMCSLYNRETNELIKSWKKRSVRG